MGRARPVDVDLVGSCGEFNFCVIFIFRQWGLDGPSIDGFPIDLNMDIHL